MRQRRRARIFVSAPHWHLQSALARMLAEMVGHEAEVTTGLPRRSFGHAVVVTTDSGASPADVAKLTTQGANVVVLAALPSARASDDYSDAGARFYLPMVASIGPLAAAVAAVLAMLSDM